MTDLEYWDYCDECMGLGDDYSIDDDGELVSNCAECFFNPNKRKEEEDADANH